MPSSAFNACHKVKQLLVQKELPCLRQASSTLESEDQGRFPYGGKCCAQNTPLTTSVLRSLRSLRLGPVHVLALHLTKDERQIDKPRLHGPRHLSDAPGAPVDLCLSCSSRPTICSMASEWQAKHRVTNLNPVDFVRNHQLAPPIRT